jgi:hypothetical protein
LKVIRISDEIIENNANFIKSLVHEGNQITFSYLMSMLSRDIVIQPVPYCDVGCAHCFGHACKNNSEVVAPKELEEYLGLLFGTSKECSEQMSKRIIFSGVYGDPFCGFAEENKVSYYDDLFKNVVSFDNINRVEFVTSCFHLKKKEEVRNLFMKIKETEQKSNASLFMKFSVDAFHGKKVPQRRIIETVKIMREVFSEEKESTFIKNRFGFIAQEMSSIDNSSSGKEYAQSFLIKLNSVFNKDYRVKKYNMKVNSTTNGRNISTGEKFISPVVMTKSADNNLVLFFSKDDCIYEYALKRNADGKLDKNHFKKVKLSLALDQLTLRVSPAFRMSLLGKKKNIFLRDYCSDDKHAQSPLHIKTSKKIAFEDFCDYS